MAHHAGTILLPLLLLLLSSLTTLSYSESPSDLPGQDLPHSALPDNEPESATILLPSEKPGSDSHTVFRLEPESSSPSDSKPLDFVTVPLTRINSRHFHERNIPLSVRFPFRRGPCRHGPGHPHRHPMRPRFGEIHYGNDMILSGGNAGEEEQEEGKPSGFVRRVRIHRIPEPRFGYADVDEMKRPRRFEGEDDEERQRENHHHWHHFHRHHFDHHYHHPEEHRDGYGENQEGGVLMKIRKFLTHF